MVAKRALVLFHQEWTVEVDLEKWLLVSVIAIVRAATAVCN